MKKTLLSLFILLVLSLSVFPQFVEYPGESSIGYGYDIFGVYASNTSTLEQVFDFGDQRSNRLGFATPDIIGITNLGMNKEYTVTEGNSLRKYAYDLSSSVSLGVDAIAFSASVESRFGKSSTESVNNYFYTISDITQAYRVYIKDAKLRDARLYLTEDALEAIDNWSVNDLISTYGTHVVVDGLMGGRMEMNLTQSFTSREEANSVGATVSASYSAVTASANMDYSQSSVNTDMKRNITIQARGGSAQYINKSIIESGDNAQYNRWVETIGEKPTLVDFDQNSLLPIWELAPANSPRQNEIKSAVLMLIRQRQDEIPEGMGDALMMANSLFYIKSLSTGLYWDLPGYHLNAQTVNGSLSLYQKEGGQTGLQGADRFIKIIPNMRDPQYIFFQPQHSDNVVTDTRNSGANPTLAALNANNESQQYLMIAIDGEEGTYLLKNRSSGLYLTASSGGVIQQAKNEGEALISQKWYFEQADGVNEMAPPMDSYIYAVKNVMANRYLDLPGAAPNQRSRDTHVQLWDFSSETDRYVRISPMNGDSNYFYIQPNHSPYVWDIEGANNDNGTALQLFDKKNTNNQQFRFIYAGSPLTYYIESRDSGRVLDASASKIDQNGCPVFIYDLHGRENQQWKLYPAPRFQTVPVDQNFLIKSAYTNTYWDLPGSGGETNANGRKFQTWSPQDSYGGDRKYRFVDSGNGVWRLIEVQNGGRVVDLVGGSNSSGTDLHLWDRHGGASQQFVLDLTTHNTFLLRPYPLNGSTVDIAGGTSDDWKRSGQSLALYHLHYGGNQHFQLIYADGPNKGKVYDFFHF